MAIPDDHLVEQTLSSEAVFDGKLLHVRRDRVRLPDGQEAVREHILHPGAVVIIVVLDNGSLVLERQYRYPLHRVLFELPAGKIDAGEAPLATAQRELLEETGYAAKDWRRLGCIHPVIAYSNEQIDIYLARGLELRKRKLDQGEFLDVMEMPLAAGMEMVRSGEITDAKTVCGLLWAEHVLGGTWVAQDGG
jgi:ADP-ribose pyrophosphatase